LWLALGIQDDARVKLHPDGSAVLADVALFHPVRRTAAGQNLIDVGRFHSHIVRMSDARYGKLEQFLPAIPE
jgi:hypothetical protein